MKQILSLLIFPIMCLGQTPCLDAVANATGKVGEFVPQCEEDGSYSPLQCWGSTGYCWCVDEDGVEISGTALGPGEGIPNCGEEGDTVNALFIGNSYIASNSLTNMIANIANSMGDYLYTESSLIGGATLQIHANNTCVWTQTAFSPQHWLPSENSKTTRVQLPASRSNQTSWLVQYGPLLVRQYTPG